MTVGRFRTLVLLSAAVPVAAGGLVAAAPLGDGAAAAALIAGAVGGLGVGLTLFFATRRLAAVAADCAAVAGGAAPPDTLAADRDDELGAVARAVRAVDNRRQQAVDAYRTTIAQLTAALAQLGEGEPLTPPSAVGPCAAEVDALAGAIQEAAKKTGAVRQRLAATARLLHNLPVGVVAVDAAGGVRFLNADAERTLGRTAAACARKPLAGLVAEPAAEPDPFERPVLGPAAVAKWLKDGAVGVAVVELARGGGPRVRTVLAAAPPLAGDGLRYLIARDLTAEYALAGADRARVREEVLRAAWAMTATAGTEPLDAVLASARLLGSDAKQSSGRDALLTRVAAVRHHAGGLEAYVRTLRWLNMVLWGELPPPLAGEFRAGEPIRAALDQLAPRLKARNLTATVSDEGGWVCGDDEWVRTALLGILAHAADAARDGTIGVRARRLPPAAVGTEERVSVEVVDAGPPLTDAQRADLERPFGGLHAPNFLTAGATGFLPGLVLAAGLARHMGGALELGATPGGGLIVRFVVPTRLPAAVPVEPAREPAETGPVEELVMGWRLGTA
jgi:signal transduction histidine kinase